MSELTKCRGCGAQHFAHESLCPRTRRPVGDGAFDTMVGPYHVGQLLGAGGFGAVYVAVDTRTGARVALKLLHPELVAEPEMLDRFVREAEVTIRAGNPHIVRVLEASFSGRAVYVALELLDGDTLGNLLRAGPLRSAQAIDIAVQALDGLAVAHANGVIHSDIKPANLFLADQPDEPRSLVKILDFGIGRLLAVDSNQRLTRTGMQLGTPHFMAPEQVTDSKRADARADLYAVAVTLFAMLTAERPYGQIAPADWLGAIARRVPARRAVSPIEALPPALVEVVAIGLEVDPAKRFQDAGAFARALLDTVPDTRATIRALPALTALPAFTMASLRAPTVRHQPAAPDVAQNIDATYFPPSRDGSDRPAPLQPYSGQERASTRSSAADVRSKPTTSRASWAWLGIGIVALVVAAVAVGAFGAWQLRASMRATATPPSTSLRAHQYRFQRRSPESPAPRFSSTSQKWSLRYPPAWSPSPPRTPGDHPHRGMCGANTGANLRTGRERLKSSTLGTLSPSCSRRRRPWPHADARWSSPRLASCPVRTSTPGQSAESRPECSRTISDVRSPAGRYWRASAEQSRMSGSLPPSPKVIPQPMRRRVDASPTSCWRSRNIVRSRAGVASLF